MKGKYSPTVYGRTNRGPFDRNAKGELPVQWGKDSTGEYDEETMFPNYDEHGYDSYGYSAYDEDGKFVGVGNGVDRNGYTEYEYMMMDDDVFNDFY